MKTHQFPHIDDLSSLYKISNHINKSTNWIKLEEVDGPDATIIKYQTAFGLAFIGWDDVMGCFIKGEEEDCGIDEIIEFVEKNINDGK